MSALGFTGKKVFVYGLGKSGFSLAASLYADGAEVHAYDERGKDEVLSTVQGKKIFAKSSVVFADTNNIDLSEFSAFFKSPGIGMDDPLVQKAVDLDIPVMGDVDLLYRREKGAMFVGITGTNGKSTVTALIGHILTEAGLKVATGGNLGTACLNLPAKQDIYVLELSSYQLETMHEAQMNVGILLNLTPDHLARHGDMDGYLQTKLNIFNDAEDTVRVMGIDSEGLEKVANDMRATSVSVDGKKADFVVTKEGLLKEGDNVILNMKDYAHLPGQHNWQNIACAYAAIKDVIHNETFNEGVKTFNNLPHRMEKIATYKGVNFYNDSKATNPDSANRALESVENIFWICGGQPKDEGMAPCLDHLSHVQAAFVIGADTGGIVETLRDKLSVYDCGSMETAVYKIWQKYKDSDLKNASVLLSPACASWDQYDSFEHRGDTFVSLCHELIGRLEEENG